MKEQKVSYLFWFSISTALYLPTWREIFYYSGTIFDPLIEKNHFYIVRDGAYLDYFAGALWVLLLSVIAHFSFSRLQEKAPRIADKAFRSILWFLFVYGIAYFVTRAPVTLLIDSFFFPTACISVFAVFICIKFSRQILELIELGIKVLIPLGLVAVINVVAIGIKLVPDSSDVFSRHKPLANFKKESQSGPRIIVLLFDAFDYHIAFEKRPANLTMPTLDKFTQKAFWPDTAYQAGSGTERAVPSMTTGRYVNSGFMIQGDKINLRFTGNDQLFPWRKQGTIFSDLSERGYDQTLLSQLYFQYCRIFHNFARKCWELDTWWSGKRESVLDRVLPFAISPLRVIFSQWSWVPQYIYFSNINYEQHFKRYLEAALAAVNDKMNDFVYMHWMLPHAPFNYDRRTQKFLMSEKGAKGYLDNLKLLDNSLKAILTSLNNADPGMKRTAVIITSDTSWYRATKLGFQSVPKVPFLITLPMQENGYQYHRPFNAMVLREVISAIADKKVVDYKGLAKYIDHWVAKDRSELLYRQNPITSKEP